MTATTIRSAKAADEKRWRELFHGYAKFYRSTVSEEVTALTWSKFLDLKSDMACLVAEQDGQVIGICHYNFHQSTWSDRPYCYLEDLYVDPESRGTGAARELILACEIEAKKRDAVRLYWHTQEYNAAARSLYDSIMPRSSFIVYRKAL
jgi:GNAT superfamily N-acetyltransferase